ncbi:aldehyde dehydrogenase family protein [Amorphoplanes digitatis]|uniref:Aldehyde dehydrogenase n=1 Tax=Actinoplanes digitatis TaxID=1868 RepID=A0A7W7MPJ9_9ACTN|nr:aldehyde dehydrogenase family protein [Actinoplanes digitatis]MBB4761615.1 acyl-CoA reductase-like NAD-dependent aldehyde dehydrogenase [Actinoplanes digitatis]GID90725.1 aldehyde dehydrogenase [Actinoplanes digitatis]
MPDLKAVEVARAAAEWWAGQGAGGRRRHLLAYKSSIAGRIDELAALIRAETGKPTAGALLEVMLAVEHLDWAARNARRVLRRRSVSPGLLALNQAAAVEYVPYGVVGVIGPWNYPVYTPMGSIAHALAAGNAVVFKPSEVTPGVGEWLADRWAELLPDRPVLQVVTGDGETGAALCRSGVDKIAFTGSTATARAVMAACAERLTPVVIEAGGKDALIVTADADLDAAARAAVFGGLGNAGQTCAGVERVYVEQAVHEPFVAALAALMREVTPGAGPDAPYGPMTTPAQPGIIRAHITGALARGARAVVGDAGSVRPPFVDPVLLTGVPEGCAAVTEETFGPVLVVNPVAGAEEAVRRANAGGYGLAGSVFTRHRRRGLALAGRMRVGAVSVNSVLGFAGVPSLPFGGVGDSGFGRVHGADGLREFSRARSVTWQRFRPPIDLMTLRPSASALRVSLAMFHRRHGALSSRSRDRRDA